MSADRHVPAAALRSAACAHLDGGVVGGRGELQVGAGERRRAHRVRVRADGLRACQLLRARLVMHSAKRAHQNSSDYSLASVQALLPCSQEKQVSIGLQGVATTLLPCAGQYRRT
jgi:hypothetical protein